MYLIIARPLGGVKATAKTNKIMDEYLGTDKRAPLGGNSFHVWRRRQDGVSVISKDPQEPN